MCIRDRITAVPPLDVFIKGVATAAFIRTKSGVELRGKPLKTPQTRQAHQKYWKESCKQLSLPELPLDTIPTSFHWNKKYHVNMASFNTGTPVDDLDTAVYTDGSGIDDRFGSGYIVLRGDIEEHRDQKHLGSLATVFQAEITAIHMAADYLLATANNRLMITFYVDSQAALMALKSTTIRSSVVLNCVRSLDALGEFTRVSLRYVKAHVGHSGNELADDMAKEGAANLDNVHGPDPLVPVSDTYSKRFLADAPVSYTHLTLPTICSV